MKRITSPREREREHSLSSAGPLIDDLLFMLFKLGRDSSKVPMSPEFVIFYQKKKIKKMKKMKKSMK